MMCTHGLKSRGDFAQTDTRFCESLIGSTGNRLFFLPHTGLTDMLLV